MIRELIIIPIPVSTDGDGQIPTWLAWATLGPLVGATVLVLGVMIYVIWKER